MNQESKSTQEFMWQNGIEFLSKCNGCGAITVTIAGRNYSMNVKSFKDRYGVDRVPTIKQHCYCCDYCVNHYGTDLCACGSGKHYRKCKEGLRECGRPMQVIELNGDMDIEYSRPRLMAGAY